MKRQAGIDDNQEKSLLSRSRVTNAENSKSDSLTYAWPPAPQASFLSGSLYGIPTSLILCPAYVSRNCPDGDRCTLSHDTNAALFGICQTFLLRSCTDKACTHKPYPLHHSQGQKPGKNELADGLNSRPVAETPLAPEPLVSNTPFRRNSNTRPDPLLPASKNVQDEFDAINIFFNKDHVPGTNARRRVADPSCRIAQAQENGRRTPPIPSQFLEPSISNKIEATSMATLDRQLRISFSTLERPTCSIL